MASKPSMAGAPRRSRSRGAAPLVVGAVCALVAAANVSACGTAPPSPAAAPPTSRTTDGSGFVDNAGRTAEESARPDTSSVRATETGSPNVTGSGTGTRFPAPSDLAARAAAAKSGEASKAEGPTDGATAELVARVAQAMCDREAICNDVGAGLRWPSADACGASLRARTMDDMQGACARGYDAIAVGVCLAAIRGQACAGAPDRVSLVNECRETALCAP